MQAFRVGGAEGSCFKEVPAPTVAGSEVLLEVEAVGLCRSDIHLIEGGAAVYGSEFTLGHEVAGRVLVPGPDAPVAVGERFVVHGPWGCDACDRCRAGAANYCDNRDGLSWAGVGIGRDGGMASQMLVPHPRYLVPIGDLPPETAAPLADAGLTAMHAVSQIREDADLVLVIGVGGLGHMALQILAALHPVVKLIAMDVRSEALALAERCGAHTVVDGSASLLDALAAVLSGTKVDAILDFVGNDESLRTSAASVRRGGDYVIVGSEGGAIELRKPGPIPSGCRVVMPYWGTRTELEAVVALAQTGDLVVESEVRSLDSVEHALMDLREGRVRGRVVLRPATNTFQ